MIPKNITKQNIIQAIEKIEVEGVPNAKRLSTKYLLDYNGKTYPPKYIISIANEFANKEFLSHDKFIATEARNLLGKLDFTIETIQLDTMKYKSFKDVANALKEKINGDHNLNLEVKHDIRVNYMHICQKIGVLTTAKNHYELTVSHNKLFVTTHFEDADTRDKIKGLVGDVPNLYEWFPWHKAESIRVVKTFSYDDVNLVEDLFDEFVAMEEVLGGNIVEAFENLKTGLIWVSDKIPLDLNKKDKNNVFWNNDFSTHFNLPKNTQSISIKIGRDLFENIPLYGGTVSHPNFTEQNAKRFLENDLIKRHNEFERIEVQVGYIKLDEQKEITKSNQPLNQILFGPSGTGKTHYLLDSIIPKFQENEIKQTKEEFESDIVSKLSWWKVIALTLLDEDELSVPEIKEHRFTKYKLAVSNTNSLNQTIWGQLSKHTVQESTTVDYSSRSKVLFFNKKENGSIWFIEGSRKELLLDLVEVISEINEYKQIDVKSKDNYKFLTFHQSYNYEDFIEGIKPNLQDKDDENEDVTYKIEKGVFYQACESAVKLAGFLSLKECIENYTKEERIIKFKNANPYALIIDEINRGNVSSIFGELITLIEEDKRLTKKEVIVELPYSKTKFSVPPNLHLYGTMNTADRSVEALDSALRRRFSFYEMPPQPDLITEKGELKERNGVISKFNINLSEILTVINRRVEKLIDKDHKIGHSYFMKVSNIQDFKDVFQKNIIPLLQEYFFGDFGKIGLVLGSGFYTSKENEISEGNFFAEVEDYDFGGLYEKKTYDFINVSDMDDDKFKEAIDKLLRN